jgi:acetyl esterase/lipase
VGHTSPVTSRRFAFVAAAVGALVLAGAAVFAACGSGSSSRSDRRIPGTTATVPAPTVTTVAPQTIPVPPLPPAGPTTAPPPAITVPRGTVSTAPPATTTPSTVTAAPASSTPPTATAAPVTTGTSPSTSTTKPGKVTRKTVVYSPAAAPRRLGDLVLPRQHADTIVLLVHGGDGTTGSRKQMRGWADFYAEHGYPSFAIDYLLVKPNTPAPVYPKPETDVKAAVQYLRQRAGSLALNPDRIIVQGFGAGAALGAQAEVTPDDAFFAGPGRHPGVSDSPAAFIGFYSFYDGTQHNPAQYYGGPPDSPDPKVQERYAKANSIAHAAGAAGPALLYQGDADDPDLVASATAFRDALQNAGKDVTLTLVAGARSGFDQEASGALTPAGQQAAQQVLAWLQARFPPA